MALAYAELQPGDVVTYRDMANPERTYVILETPNQVHPFDFKMINVSEDGPWDLHFSDCRQHGWNLVKKMEPSI